MSLSLFNCGIFTLCHCVGGSETKEGTSYHRFSLDAKHASNTERNGTGGQSDRRLGEAKKGAGGAVVYCDATEMPCWRINFQEITLHNMIFYFVGPDQ